MTDPLDHNPDGLLPDALFTQSEPTQFSHGETARSVLDLDAITQEAGYWAHAPTILALIDALLEAQQRIERIIRDNEQYQRELEGNEEVIGELRAEIALLRPGVERASDAIEQVTTLILEREYLRMQLVGAEAERDKLCAALYHYAAPDRYRWWQHRFCPECDKARSVLGDYRPTP
jgi:chromosome segregation ATPase